MMLFMLNLLCFKLIQFQQLSQGFEWYIFFPILCFQLFIFSFFLGGGVQYCGFNSGLLVCYAGSLSLEPLRQIFFVFCFFEIGSHELFAWAIFKPKAS
jgi:hypothetical protein